MRKYFIAILLKYLKQSIRGARFMPKPQERTKVVVLGIDSGDWDIIKPLIKNGSLMNISRFISEGVYGYLKSTIPPSTLPAWKSYSTGKYRLFRDAYWYTFDPENKSLRIVDLGKIQRLPEIWDYLSLKNYKVAVINFPASYPPKRVNGVFISGFPAQDYMNYTYPKLLKDKLIKLFNYRVSPRKVLQPLLKNFDEKKEIVEEIVELMKMRIDVAEYFLTELKVDFLHITLFYMDNLQHYLLDTKEDLELLFKAWAEVDKHLDKLFKVVKEYNGIMFLMSDHGMAKLRATLYLNNLLMKMGYLYLSKGKTAKSPSTFVLSKINLFRAYRFLQKRPFNFLLKLVPEKMLLKAWFTLKRNPYEISLNELLAAIDWEKTVAVSVSDHGIYINRRAVKNYEVARRRIIDLLSRVKSPTFMENPFEKIYICEELYGKECNEIGLDIAFLWKDGYLIHPSLRLPLNKIWLIGSREGYSGFHRLHGFFGVWGDRVKREYYTGFNVTISDLAPTILFLFGIDPSKLNIEGRVLTEVFEEDVVRSKVLEDLSSKLKLYTKLKRLKGSKTPLS